MDSPTRRILHESGDFAPGNDAIPRISRAHQYTDCNLRRNQLSRDSPSTDLCWKGGASSGLRVIRGAVILVSIFIAYEKVEAFWQLFAPSAQLLQLLKGSRCLRPSPAPPF